MAKYTVKMNIKFNKLGKHTESADLPMPEQLITTFTRVGMSVSWSVSNIVENIMNGFPLQYFVQKKRIGHGIKQDNALSKNLMKISRFPENFRF